MDEADELQLLRRIERMLYSIRAYIEAATGVIGNGHIASYYMPRDYSPHARLREMIADPTYAADPEWTKKHAEPAAEGAS